MSVLEEKYWPRAFRRQVLETSFGLPLCFLSCPVFERYASAHSIDVGCFIGCRRHARLWIRVTGKGPPQVHLEALGGAVKSACYDAHAHEVATLVVDIGFNVPKKSEVLTVNGQLLHGTLKAVVGKDPLQVFSLHAPVVCRFPLAARRVLTFVAYGHAAFHRRRDGAVPPTVPQSLVVVAQQRR